MTYIEQAVHIPIGKTKLEGNITIPNKPKGLVLFAHGSGSSRFSIRNKFVANYLIKNNLATLLIDLLTPEEGEVDEINREFRFDINLLAERLILISNWLLQDPLTKTLSIGYFGSSTGAAGALKAAAKMGSMISAVVSRGGRPDLVLDDFDKVKSPTLLIVGGNDYTVIELNQLAFDQLKCEKKMEIVPNATHLFEEPGTLEQVANLAGKWFLDYHSHLSVKEL